MEHAWVSLASFMQQFLQRRKQELHIETGDRGDLFTRLVAASDGVGKYAMDDQEVVSLP